jgi:hypothetical protein
MTGGQDIISIEGVELFGLKDCKSRVIVMQYPITVRPGCCITVTIHAS